MKQKVILSIRGQQNYPGQDPEMIELVTEGTLSAIPEGWEISYEESDLTGLAGTTTTFRVEPGCITLTRVGPLSSQMVFREGVYHESLYQMAFGAMMISVCASQVDYQITERGGSIDLVYAIEIENTTAGSIEYHLDIQGK